MEKINNWEAYIVLLMGKSGDHKLLKVCIQTKPGVLSFVVNGGELCKPKVDISEK